MEYVRCVLCDSDSGKPLYKAPSAVLCLNRKIFNVVKCSNCGLLYLNPRIPEHEIAKFYGDHYYKKDRFWLKSLLEDDIPLRWLQRAKRIEVYERKSRILDIGCGGGKFLRSLSRKNWEIHGTEISETAARNAASISGANVFVGKLKKARFKKNYFDVITLWHTFEHIPNPLEILEEIYRILKKDGLLVIAVPNIESFQSKIAKEKWYHLDVPYHYNHYSPETLRKIIEKANFKVFKVNHFVLKNFYGFIQSLLNLMGFEKNFIKNVLLAKDIERSSKGKLGDKAQLSLSLIVLPFVIILSVLVSFLESILKKGGTIEVYAWKK
jgi:2-polyprenyl-3-methyl-5-hydroxy-6-metoxy-1,4-benzoquinol methylase